MYVLPHQLELFSPAWAEEARAFLNREQSRLGGRAFSISGRLTDAPPHLEAPDGVLAWTARVADGAVEVAPGFDDAAEFTVEGDYQAAVTAAQRVGITSPGEGRALLAEVAHLYGPTALRVRNQFNDGATLAVLAGLFDHLGRRTVENPDLAHRAERQGLAGKIREMETQGFTVLENALTPEFADEARASILDALSAHGATTLNWMLYQGRALERLAIHPLLMTLIDASLGRGAVIGSLSCIRKETGPGFIPLHTDYAHVPEPYPEWAMTGVGVWAFEDWTEASGPTVIAPGSHLKRRYPRPGEDPGPGVPICMPKGSVVFFTNGVWHWQGDRTEPGERVTLHSHFNRGILRSLEAKRIDPQMLRRNPPRMGEILGEDDWFEKTDGEGRDYGRYAHMTRLHTFTERRKREILEGADDVRSPVAA